MDCSLAFIKQQLVPAMIDLEFWSDDRQFGLLIAEKQVAEMLHLCRRVSPFETGGILLGHYAASHDRAIVTEITRAPADSQSGSTWFVRGVRGLQQKLDRLWQRNQAYYLGEWHFHPFGPPRPSPTDQGQMQEISHSKQYHCPEPVLLILGGDPKAEWSASAYVFPKDHRRIEMRIADAG